MAKRYTMNGFICPLDDEGYPQTVVPYGGVIYLAADYDALEADLARCRAANVYDANAHRKAAEFEVALRKIAAVPCMAVVQCHWPRVLYQGETAQLCTSCEARAALPQTETKEDPAAREARGWCKHDDGACHADDPCDDCPVYRKAEPKGDENGK